MEIRKNFPVICSKTICSPLEASKYFIPVKKRKESQMIYSVLANGTYRINFDVPSEVSSNWYIAYMCSGTIMFSGQITWLLLSLDFSGFFFATIKRGCRPFIYCVGTKNVVADFVKNVEVALAFSRERQNLFFSGCRLFGST